MRESNLLVACEFVYRGVVGPDDPLVLKLVADDAVRPAGSVRCPSGFERIVRMCALSSPTVVGFSISPKHASASTMEVCSPKLFVSNWLQDIEDL